ncbi:MAG TPA: exopolyphosphatase [Cyclobacteriaceae bacterium]|nr:exopolyphosphatase [Cyclobacteriaceae bacterium]
MSRIAIIDLGTNTFHLLIADVSESGYHIIHRDRLAVKIGMGGINRGYITESGMQRAMVALQSFRNTIDEMRAQKVYAFGTSALRNAKNRIEVVDKVKAVTGIDVNIISGDQEAEFIYYGVKSAVGLGQEISMIMDIGGGSVEFIIANSETIFWKGSFEIGAQRLLEKFQHHDPIQQNDIEALDKFLYNSLSPLHEVLKSFHPTVLVGSSGTFDTLSDIFCARHHILKTPDEVETPLTIEGFYDIYRELLVKDREARMLIPGMIEMRVDMIVVACCLIKHILESHPFTRIRVSTYSLKEGVLSWLGKAVTV